MNIYFLLIAGTEAMLIVALVIVVYLVIRQKSKLHHLADLQNLRAEHNQRMIAGIVKTTEDERRRIARDIHDDIGQSLLVLKMNLGRADQIEQSKLLLDKTLGSLHDIAHDLYPAGLSKFGLAHEIQYLLSTARQNGLEVNDEYDRDIASFRELDLAVYRITQELMQNTLKHSGADTIRFSLLVEGQHLVLKYNDNGVGLPQNGSSRGMGMMNIASRISAMKALSDEKTTTDGGYSLEIKFPLNHPQTILEPSS